jgi:hypothetical protein
LDVLQASLGVDVFIRDYNVGLLFLTWKVTTDVFLRQQPRFSGVVIVVIPASKLHPLLAFARSRPQAGNLPQHKENGFTKPDVCLSGFAPLCKYNSVPVHNHIPDHPSSPQHLPQFGRSSGAELQRASSPTAHHTIIDITHGLYFSFHISPRHLQQRPDSSNF